MKFFYTFLILLITGGSFSQTTQTFTSDKDNTLYSENNNSNGAGENFFAGVTNSGAKRRGLIHFDLSSIPSNAVVTSATLTIYCNRLAGNAAGVRVYKLTANWGEGSSQAGGNEGQGATATAGDATWTNRIHPSTPWSTAGGDYVGTPTATNTNVNFGAVPFTGSTLLADVQGFVANAASNFGWIVVGSNESLSQSALRFGAHENATVAERPTLSVTYTVNMPVTLSKFTAYLSKGDALLQWQTVTEANNLYFEIEHSVDAKRFSALGRVDGNGNSTDKHDYTFIHANIPAGKNYYRLVQVDANGSKQISPVVLVSAAKSTTLDVYPNPAQTYLQVNAPFVGSKREYRIINFTGQLLQQGILQGQQVNVQSLPAGQYYLSIQSPEGIWYKSSFLKN